MMKKDFPAKIVLAVLWVAVPPLASWAQPVDSGERRRMYDLPDLEALQEAFVRLANDHSKPVVAIRARLRDADGSTSRSQGSGFIIREDGMILTNEHVVEDAISIQVTLNDGSKHDAKLVSSDYRGDMAVIKIEGRDLPVAKLGDADRIKKGQWAFALGNPFGLALEGDIAFTSGVVSALGRVLHLDEARYYGNLIETSADINPGNSGGPLINIQGEVIGMNTAISTRTGVGEGVGFAIPMTGAVKRIINTLMNGEKVRYGYLGVIVRTPTLQELREAGISEQLGAVIDDILPGPASKANLQKRDILLVYDGTAIVNYDHLVRMVGSTAVGETVLVKVRRGSTDIELPVTIAEREDGSSEPPSFEVVPWQDMILTENSAFIRQQLEIKTTTPGVVVVEVLPESAAAKSGVAVGDVIVRVGTQRVESLDDFRDAVAAASGAIRLRISGGKTVKLEP